jgi:four helix bundle protein
VRRAVGGWKERGWRLRDFKRLEVWRLSHELALNVYKESAGFPSEEKFGLTTQLRRSAASIPANLAEGAGRDTDADFRRFVDIAAGSACETEYHLLLARDLRYLPPEVHETLDADVNQIKKMLAGLARSLRSQG